MPTNVPAFAARNKSINDPGLTADVNADSAQLAALTMFANGLPADAASRADMDSADLALDTRLDDVETDLTFVEQEVTDLQNDLDTKADLVTGKVPLAQLAFGSDAAAGILRPQRGLRVSFGGRVSVRSQHYWDETEVNATSGDVFAVDAAYHITAYNPGFTLASEADAGTLAARIGSLVALRSDVFVNIPLGTLPGGVPKLINGTGNGLLYLQPNEWVLLRYTATGYDVLQRGSTAAPGVGAPSSGGTSTSYLQIRSVNGKRVVEIPVLSPVTVLEEIFDTNVQGVEYQLDTQTRTGTRQFGTPGISRADVLPLLAALTAPDYAAGVKLYARTVVTSPPDPATLILKFEYA